MLVRSLELASKPGSVGERPWMDFCPETEYRVALQLVLDSADVYDEELCKV